MKASFPSNDWIGRFRQRAWPNPELSLVNACYPVPRDEAPGGSRSTCCCQSRCPKIFMPQLVPEQGFRKTGFNEAPNFSGKYFGSSHFSIDARLSVAPQRRRTGIAFGYHIGKIDG
ncbi:hypothetical protein T11_13139 [Trichinella zimbabwensis]|uniref:Uncharacterized protein n=1 Tax=Trichinella zimbabwensis TaxID=268475 RepID=A0A0V1GX92_9BILA|nr:hypothetical protein T11_13139 [Trichinella zimbabwensis]